MYRSARMPAVVMATALAIMTTGCGGYGVDLRSGGSKTATQVAITATSGTTLNPYPLLVMHTVVFVAHPSAGNVVNYGIDEPARWDSSNPGLVVLLEPNCGTPYGGEPTTTICVFANTLAKTTANIDATTGDGAIGTIGVAVTN